MNSVKLPFLCMCIAAAAATAAAVAAGNNVTPGTVLPSLSTASAAAPALVGVTVMSMDEVLAATTGDNPDTVLDSMHQTPAAALQPQVWSATARRGDGAMELPAAGELLSAAVLRSNVFAVELQTSVR